MRRHAWHTAQIFNVVDQALLAPRAPYSPMSGKHLDRRRRGQAIGPRRAWLVRAGGPEAYRQVGVAVSGKRAVKALAGGQCFDGRGQRKHRYTALGGA
jgi:hypothetical protein